MARTRPRWTFPVVAFLGAVLLRLWRLTWRVDEEPRRQVLARMRARAPGEPGTVYLIWHSRLLLAAGTHVNCGMSAMISLHGDGEYIARTVARLGIRAVRGSTTRGGARALLGAVEILRAGGDVTFTPDGPKGPRFRVQQGCVAAASMAGAPLVPVSLECRPATRLRSWDRFLVPWFFSRVVLRYGEEMRIPPDLDDAALETWRLRAEEAMHAIHRVGAAAAGTGIETPDLPPIPSTASPPPGTMRA